MDLDLFARRLQNRKSQPAARYRVIRNDSGAATRVDIMDDIVAGDGWFGGVSAQDVVAQLAEITGDVEVHINSGGGDVFEGIAIYNELAQRPGNVTTVVVGIAASIASVIAQAGKTRVVAPGAMLMIHDALCLMIGNAADMRETADVLDKVSDTIATVYASRGGTAADWRKRMQAETWYTAQDAVDAGLADALAERPAAAEAVAAHDFSLFAKVPDWLAAAAKAHPAPAAPAGDGLDEQVTAIVHRELHLANATVDESSWDGPAAMSAAAKSDNPAAALAAICAGRRDGDPATIAAHALPHHKHQGDPPNRAGVTAALGRIDQTEGLTNKSAAQAHLDAHQKAMGDGDGDADDHSHAGFAWSGPDKFRASLERKASEH